MHLQYQGGWGLAGLGWPQLGCLICSIGPSLCRTLGQAVQLVATQPSEKERERERKNGVAHFHFYHILLAKVGKKKKGRRKVDYISCLEKLHSHIIKGVEEVVLQSTANTL